ncbi:DUF3298 and DUF4163 domain-containing protein [Velocimicrobium porci]|uniref:DUF3298 and DUF4163 domain-containing protein n=1 Tax=Velocimicrobium porci TaxID=2606634 RepID=A0A6L5XV47_9FIRM|nr:DUF3298 and DUF4163 domain-containing protein [Velocimicrobium porci]MSS62479.1 DUF3298 and DUF4163 domain-containing protein [Velocimicrobium porci]
MNLKDELKEMKQEYDNIEIPEACLNRIQQGIDMAKMEKKRASKKKAVRNWAVSVVAASVVFIVLPNTNQSVAQAMEKIPVIGNIVKVVTFNRYEVKQGTMEADVKVPQIETNKNKEASEGVKKVNKDIKAYTDKLIASFNEDMEKNGEHEALDVSYDVITDNDKLFSLKITAVETMASAVETVRYYHLDKETGKVLELKDLFKENADYVSIITDYIKKEMRKQMKDEEKTYFLDSEDMPEYDFQKIKKNQNFYFNKSGNLVIAFDEYEVAPGYMGCPEFEIPNQVIENILK